MIYRIIGYKTLVDFKIDSQGIEMLQVFYMKYNQVLLTAIHWKSQRNRAEIKKV